ncbi:hypothetical protein Bca52824_068460 [Brassica carinata]|uniref:Secreted protein n=1 Tax=Brassica carinata TaxID=52824 RepID=A0A8X7U350_BRACI|nr:hypothetical protein Bca52824_068460 [Brassica carinata]
MTSHFFIVFIVVILTIANGTLAADAEKPQPVDNKSSPADNSTKSLVGLGPSQDYPDYEIPVELAPDGVEEVGDYMPISPNGGQDKANRLAQPESNIDVKASQSTSSASRSSSTVLPVAVAAAGGAASLFSFETEKIR